MSREVIISIEIDDSLKDNDLFNSTEKLIAKKADIFRYGVLNLEVPPNRIGENQFEYKQSKIPALFSLYDDFICVEDSQLINNGTSENAVDVSELIGVGIGIKYVVNTLNINANKIIKIPRPNKCEKYLDFEFKSNSKKYELETKGTAYERNVNSMINEIKEKKRNKSDTAVRIGTVTCANKKKSIQGTKIVVCDSNDDIKSDAQYTIGDYYNYYMFVLSLILDNPKYNKMNRTIKRRSMNTKAFDLSMLHNKYCFNNKCYYGQYFDKRLIVEFINENYRERMSVDRLFELLTQNVGRYKYFLGIDESILQALIHKDVDTLEKGTNSMVFEINDNKIYLNNDGILFVVSNKDYDEQIAEGFTENDVKNRLEIMYNYYINRTPHECGAPCRSREKEGKPCEKMTYLEHCYFHRE